MFESIKNFMYDAFVELFTIIITGIIVWVKEISIYPLFSLINLTEMKLLNKRQIVIWSDYNDISKSIASCLEKYGISKNIKIVTLNNMRDIKKFYISTFDHIVLDINRR